MITIQKDEVQALARLAGIRLDDERIGVLCSPSSGTVQAVPGSGKTTLVALKLCILLRAWPVRNRGICVLSHTNVARTEILHAALSLGLRNDFISYPHFSGTIQRFADEFLAIPWLQSRGCASIRISDDEFSLRARRLICRPQFSYLNGSLKRSAREGADPYGPLDKLQYEDGSLSLPSIVKAAPETPTGKQIVALKRQLSKEGYFTYRDMLAVALHAIEKCPGLKAVLRRRFPVVFVDEAQDNSALQNALLHSLFSEGGSDCVVQMFGDSNQAIYRDKDEPPASSPSQRLVVATSFRFGKNIASFASHLQVEPHGGIIGTEENSEVHVILFRRADVDRVFDVFGGIVSKAWPGGLETLNIRAVGYKRTEGTGAAPSCIWDYVPGLERRASGGSAHTTAPPWIHVLSAIESVKSGDANEAWSHLLHCVEFLCKTRRSDSPGAADMTLDIGDFLKATYPGRFKEWRSWFGNRFLNGVGAIETMAKIQDVFSDLGLDPVGELTDDSNDRLRGSESEAPASYSCSLSNGCRVLLGTIHGCKGESHDATLVLETKHYEYDISYVLDKMAEREEKARSAKRGKPVVKLGLREKAFMRHLYVAVTRPRRVLCLAVCVENLSARALDWLGRAGVTLVQIKGEGPENRQSSRTIVAKDEETA